MVLLGITWVFGTMAVGSVRLVFQYFFCFSNSLQGFLIFLVRCLLYPEARNAWLYLLHTGKLKRHRGVVPVSFNSNSGGRNGLSPTTTAMRTESSDDTASLEHGGFRCETVSKIVRNSPRTRSIKYRRGERPPHCIRFVKKSKFENERSNNNDHDDTQRNLKSEIEVNKNGFKWRHPHQYAEEERRNAYRQRAANYLPERRVVLPKVTLRVSPHVCDHPFNLYPISQREKRSASMDESSSPKGSSPPENISTFGRSMSSLPKYQLTDKRRITRRKKGKRSLNSEIIKKNSTFYEVDEGVQFDKSSSSTDVDDSASECSTLEPNKQTGTITIASQGSSSPLDSYAASFVKQHTTSFPIEIDIGSLGSSLKSESITCMVPVQVDSIPEEYPIFLKCKTRISSPSMISTNKL